MNAMTENCHARPLHARFDGPIVMIGFGSIGRGTLPLIERHIGFDRSKSSSLRRRTTTAACSMTQAALCAFGDYQGELPRRADPARDRGTGPRHDHQSFGRYVLGRADGIRP